MKMQDLVLVSVDDHLVEPPDLFEKHIPAKYKDDAPSSSNGKTARTHGFSRARKPLTTASMRSQAGHPKVWHGADQALGDPRRLLRHP